MHNDPAASASPAETFNSDFFERHEVLSVAAVMCRYAAELNDFPQFDRVVSGHGDTGTITMESDLRINDALMRQATALRRFAFSEEEDPKDQHGTPQRLRQPSIIEYDPVDGSGDRKKQIGGANSASARGYTSLAAFLHHGTPVAGICVRPAHGELWIFSYGVFHGSIQRFALGGTLSPIPFGRLVNPRPYEVRVNFRPAYDPETTLPPEVFERARELTDNRYTFVPTEAGGAGDCFCRLLRGDLDIVHSGRRTDWKTWDTDPFAPALHYLRAQFTDYDGRDIDVCKAYNEADPWHTRGVLASLRVHPLAHNAFQSAIAEFQERSRRERQPPLFYDPRRV